MFAQAEVSPVPARGRNWLEVKLWGGDSESVGAEYIDTHCPVPRPYTVGSGDMDTSPARPPLMATYYLLGSSTGDPSEGVNI